MKKYEITKYFEDRSADGTRYKDNDLWSAISDLNRAGFSDVFMQDNGRYVIRGSNGCVHIIHPSGEVITTFSPDNFRSRVSDGKYSPLTETQKKVFADKFGSYLNGQWGSYK